MGKPTNKKDGSPSNEPLLDSSQPSSSATSSAPQASAANNASSSSNASSSKAPSGSNRRVRSALEEKVIKDLKDVFCKLHIPVPTPDTTLGQLRQTIADHIHLPPTSFKLIHSGAVMKGDSFPITAYSIKSGSTIQVVGGLAPIPGRTRKTSTASSPSGSDSRPTEQAIITLIHNEMTQVRQTLVPSVQSFQTNISSNGNAPPTNLDTLKQEHTRLGELLLQTLLRLDALVPQSEWMDARKERKTAVREVQGLLAQLD
ncbi:hypothetical protein FRB99_008428, partial [Tulasnella sp. 403]